MYATRDDLIKRFGENEIANLEAMQTSLTAVNDALQDATEEIDTYIAVQYNLPLPNVPNTLKRVACNIARFRLYYQQPTEEVRKRYEDEIVYLKRIADKKAVLSILDHDNAVTDEKPSKQPSTMPIGTTYRGGVFGDDVLNKMPDFK